MIKVLEEKRKRCRELESLLAQPDVAKDKALYSKYAKEMSSLSNVVRKYEKFLQTEEEISNLEEMLKEKHDADFIELAKTEIGSLREKTKQLKKELEEDLLASDPQADKNIIVEIRAGTGGLEAGLFAADLYRMYVKFAQKNGYKVEMLSTSPQESGGIKEIIFSVEGQGAYRNFKYESGVHRVQRVPETEASGRIHTSAATVAVLPEAEEVDLKIDPKDLKIDVFRAGGAGGQHVNVTDSAVRITYLPLNIVVSCQDERSQHKNKAKAMKVLRARILDVIRTRQQQKMSNDRKLQVGTGDRSEKIRTYNFPEKRITDHRIGFTLHQLDLVMQGQLDEIVAALLGEERKKKLENLK